MKKFLVVLACLLLVCGICSAEEDAVTSATLKIDRLPAVEAQENGIQLIILVEHGGQIKSLGDVYFWDNPRRAVSPKAITGEALYKSLLTIRDKYGVRFEFCEEFHTGRKIVELLGGDPDGASVMLYNGEEIVDQTVFDIDYGNQFEYHWGFQIPRSVENKDQYQLRLYAGVSEGTEGISLVYQGIRVQECLLSDQK